MMCQGYDRKKNGKVNRVSLEIVMQASGYIKVLLPAASWFGGWFWSFRLMGILVYSYIKTLKIFGGVKDILVRNNYLYCYLSNS